MSVNDLLSQDEIDALLHGVSSEDIDTDNGEEYTLDQYKRVYL